MGVDTYLRVMVALAVVVAMIAIAGWAARRFGWGTRFIARAGERRLAVLEVLPMDGKRRLVLLRRDGVEHLVLLGSAGDLVIERGIGISAETSAELRSLFAQGGP
jgi:flagellar protein FliO/FliZ